MQNLSLVVVFCAFNELHIKKKLSHHTLKYHRLLSNINRLLNKRMNIIIIILLIVVRVFAVIQKIENLDNSSK